MAWVGEEDWHSSIDSDERFIPTPYADYLKVASIESVMQDIDEIGSGVAVEGELYCGDAG